MARYRRGDRVQLDEELGTVMDPLSDDGRELFLRYGDYHGEGGLEPATGQFYVIMLDSSPDPEELWVVAGDADLSRATEPDVVEWTVHLTLSEITDLVFGSMFVTTATGESLRSKLLDAVETGAYEIRRPCGKQSCCWPCSD